MRLEKVKGIMLEKERKQEISKPDKKGKNKSGRVIPFRKGEK
jgi:hypothetical protein